MSISTEKEEMWKRLKYVPKPLFVDVDISSLYPHQADLVLSIERAEEGIENVKFKVLKNR